MSNLRREAEGVDVEERKGAAGGRGSEARTCISFLFPIVKVLYTLPRCSNLSLKARHRSVIDLVSVLVASH